MKRKRIIFIIIMILVVGITISSYFFYRSWQQRQNMIATIKNSYSEYVTCQKKKKIYQKEKDNYTMVGTIYPNMVISLVKKDIKDEHDIYYQIKGTNYYLDYQNLKAVKSKKIDTSFDHYVITKKIKTNPTKLYKDNQLYLELKEEKEFSVLLIDNEKYYVKYEDEIYYIQSDYEIIDQEIIKELLKDISVLNFSNDISNNKLEEVLKLLQENQLESLTLEDFKRWITGKVNLNHNKVLLLSYQELDDSKKELVEKYHFHICTDMKDLTFSSGDTKLKIGDTTYYKYEINSNTTMDRVKDMLNGIKEVIIPQGQSIAVLNYHFFYDGNGGEVCDESICLDVSNFRKQLDYLRDNGFKTLTIKEFTDWMYGRITLPKKSVLLTVDDGAMGTSAINGNKLIPILEEYQMHATLFLITGWWDRNNYRSSYLDVQSHGNELHHKDNGTAKGLTLSKEDLKSDLMSSISKVDNNLSFCYPFYEKNSTMVEAIKESGFQIAFIGSNKKAKQSMDKYAIPRYIIYKNTSLDSFINIVN